MTDELALVPPGHHTELALLVQILRHAFGVQTGGAHAAPVVTDRLVRVMLFSMTQPIWDALSDVRRPLQLLVVTDHDEATDLYPFLANAEKRMCKAIEHRQPLRHRAQISVHSVADFERQVSAGSTLLRQILRRGVTLHRIARPAEPRVLRLLSPAEAMAEASAQNEACRRLSRNFLERAVAERRSARKAVFLLQQAAEHAYARALRVLALYAPRSHDLATLRGLAEPLAPRLAAVWPDAEGFPQDAFEKLRASYAHRRAARTWAISETELAWLAMRTNLLVRTVDSLCEEGLEAMHTRALAGGGPLDCSA